ncbi:WhiB family transcriptional regulator [Ilumatobacter coccineus]|uniref:WhiB family transcriptional regulator n=1 Tax=Ilumatobacter coccineus TaxID=467094 RepID=UPI00059C0867
MSGDEWRRRAACRGLSPSLFFPERGESNVEAKAVCASCSVSIECLNESQIRYLGIPTAGIWAGTTARERSYFKTDDQPIDQGMAS